MSLADQFDLPEGAIPNGCVGVCQYLTAEGEMNFAYVYDTTEMPLSSTLGLLDLAKYHIHALSQEDSS